MGIVATDTIYFFPHPSMKNHRFLLGAASGMTALALAVPALAQVAGAQGAPSADTAPQDKTTMAQRMRGSLTADQIKEMAAHDDAFLANVDGAVSVLKAATQAHRDALNAAATIGDETTRQEAVQKANETYRTAIESAIAANPDLKEGFRFGPMGGHGFGMKGGMRHGPGDLAKKLGMTGDELKAALDAGKTIEEIAQEKGIELPARPEGGRGMFGGQKSSDSQ